MGMGDCEVVFFCSVIINLLLLAKLPLADSYTWRFASFVFVLLCITALPRALLYS